MKITPATCDGAPICLIYGAEGRGKTTLGSKFPKPVAMLLERGLPRGVTIDAINDLATFGNVVEALRELCRDPNGYQTLVVDTLDALEPMLLDHLCGQRGWKDIETPSYGKGYVAADEVWRGFIKGITTLRDRHGVTIVLVAHSTVERFDDPRAPTYKSILAETAQARSPPDSRLLRPCWLSGRGSPHSYRRRRVSRARPGDQLGECRLQHHRHHSILEGVINE